MKQKRILSLFLAGTMLVGALAACAPAAQQPAAPADQASPTAPATSTAAEPTPPPSGGPSGSLTFAMQGEPSTLAPARHNLVEGLHINGMTHEQLFGMHYADFSAVPRLVSDIEFISDTEFLLTLHEGIMFHHGREMTAEDVVGSLQWVRQFPEARGVHLSLEAEDIHYVSRYQFRLETRIPIATLFDDLAGTGNAIFPMDLVDAGHDFHTDPIGSGPFRFVEWNMGNSLSLTAFEDYFNPERAARIQDMHFRIIPEGASRTIAYEMGEIDFIIDVPFPDVRRLQDMPDTEVVMLPSPQWNMLHLNHQTPQFSNVHVRRALMMATNQEDIVLGAFDGFARPTRAQAPLVFPGTTAEGIIPYDPAGAAALLAEHGIDPADIGFEMLVSTEERRRIAEIMQAQFAEKLGIQTTVTMMDGGVWAERVLAGDYVAAMGQWASGWLISGWRNQVLGDIPGTPNRNHVNNLEMNALINQGISTVDFDARAAIFEEVSRMVNEYVVVIPTHITYTFRAFNSNLRAPEMAGLSTVMNFNMMYWAD